MFAIKGLYNWVFTPPPSQEWYLREYKRLVQEIEAFGTDGDSGAANNRHVEESYMPDAEFFKYNGMNLLRPILVCTMDPNFSGFEQFWRQ